MDQIAAAASEELKDNEKRATEKEGVQEHSSNAEKAIQEEGIAPFVAKLYDLVSDSKRSDLIRWSLEHANAAFLVLDPSVFAAEVLPVYFKHNNFCSFVRQLNIYGFHKIESKNGYAFQHEYFRKDRKDLLRYIQRRKPSKKSPPPTQNASFSMIPASFLSFDTVAQPPFPGNVMSCSPSSASPPPAKMMKPIGFPEGNVFPNQGILLEKLCQDLSYVRSQNENLLILIQDTAKAVAECVERQKRLEMSVLRIESALKPMDTFMNFPMQPQPFFKPEVMTPTDMKNPALRPPFPPAQMYYGPSSSS